MDDYNINVLSEAKNEYSCRLLSILTPVVIDGVKSIFNDAERLCIENDEDDKYLMTFQNFLSRKYLMRFLEIFLLEFLFRWLKKFHRFFCLTKK